MICILGMLLVSAAIFYAARRIVRPIKELTDNFSRATQEDINIIFDGERKEHLSGHTVVEIDILHAALQKMLDQIVKGRELAIKSAEANLENEALQASSEAKNKFFANMSHEIRTPMNAIMGIAEILLYDPMLTEQQRKYIKDIKMSSESLLTIINDILDISKLESGKLVLIPDNFNLRGMLDNICSLALYLTAEKHLAFRYETEGEIPLSLYGDDVRLRQVLLNLLSNAVKFTHEGSLTLRVVVTTDTLLFSFIDTGVGISLEEQARLFQPFIQADITANRKIKGTGLGLAISKSLVDAMGGQIALTSEHGRGSTFTVTIPKVLGDETALRQEAAAVATSFSPSLKVLIVDDNEVNLSVASGLMKTFHGIHAELALSGPEAVDKAKNTPYDLIFMDHMMPGMDGVEAARLIRALGERYASIPIIALTANAMAGIKDMLMASGLNDFLAKPIIKMDLAEILYKWVPADKRSARAETEAKEGPAPQELASVITPDALHWIREINLDAGLEAVAGQQEVYEHSLRLMNDKIPKITRLMAELLEQGNVQELTVHVHGMKSSLATVGALMLSATALDIEKAGKAGDLPYVRECLPSFIEQLQGLGNKLHRLFSESEHTAKTIAGDAATLEDGLAALRQALEQHDHEELGRILDSLLSFDFGETSNAALAQVKKDVDVFEYETARVFLNTFRA